MENHLAEVLLSVLGVILGIIGKHYHGVWETHQIGKRTPEQPTVEEPSKVGGNGYVRPEKVREMMREQQAVCGQLFEAKMESVEKAAVRTETSVGKIFDALDGPGGLKEIVNRGFASHGERLRVLEGKL